MLRGVIVGCGLIATRKFIPICKRLKSKVALVGICDTNEGLLKGRVENLIVHDSELCSVLLGRIDHLLAICRRKGHGFLNENIYTVLERFDDEFCMHRRRCTNHDDVWSLITNHS